MIRSLASLFARSPDFRAGLAWVDRIADEIGAERKVFASALTEAGVNYATWLKMFEAAAEDLPDESERIRSFALMLIPRAEQGLALMTARFGKQTEIIEVSGKLAAYTANASSKKGGKP